MESSKSRNSALEQAEPVETGQPDREPFLQRRSVLLSALIVGLLMVVAVPTFLLSSESSEDCNSGNALKDNACLNAMRRAGKLKEKEHKFNVRPKGQPFKIGNRLGGDLAGAEKPDS